GAEQERLAGVEALAAAEDCGGAGLGPKLVGALPAARARRAGTDLDGAGPLAVGNLLAATEADPYRGGVVGRDRQRRGVLADDGVDVERMAEDGGALGDQRVQRALVLAHLLQPAPCLALLRERARGSDDGDARQRHGWGRRLLVGLARSAPPPWWRGRAMGLDRQNGLLPVLPHHVPSVGDPEGAGEIELREAEDAQSEPSRPPDGLSGSEYGEGVVRTRGLSISPRRSVRRCHWSGLSSASNCWSNGPLSGL